MTPPADPDQLTDPVAADAWAHRLLASRALPDQSLRRINGWSNRVWLSDRHVLRLSSGRFRDSFTYERAVIDWIGNHLPVHRIVAVGRVGMHEWMLSERVAGRTLLRAWPDLPIKARRAAVHQLGRHLSVLHRLPVPDSLVNPWLQDAAQNADRLQDAYCLPPPHSLAILEELARRGTLPATQLALAERVLTEHLPLFSGDSDVLIHADAHFNNLMWDGAQLTLLDFETATVAAPDRELNFLRLFLDDPADAVPRGESSTINATDVADVLPWLAETYPALFDQPNAEERQLFYALTRALLQTLHFPPGHAQDPRPRIEALLHRA